MTFALDSTTLGVLWCNNGPSGNSSHTVSSTWSRSKLCDSHLLICEPLPATYNVQCDPCVVLSGAFKSPIERLQ